MPAPELRQTILASSACLLLGAACGWWLRGDSIPVVVAVERVPPTKTFATPAPTAAPRETSPSESSADISFSFANEIRLALADRDPLSREIRIRETIQNLDPANLPAAVVEAARAGKERWDVYEMLGARWGATNPLNGLEYAESLQDEAIRRSLIEGIAGAWVAQDQSAAVAWMNAKPDDRP